MSYQTEQEQFWASEFGNEYIDRNQGAETVASYVAMFVAALQTANGVESVLEFGSNCGMNLDALSVVLPNADLTAIEINTKAADIVEQRYETFRGSILEFESERMWDMTLISGVLIHIAPERLSDVYRRLYQYARRYILVCEYYNPEPVALPYRGHQDRLFKRDFAGEMLDAYPDLELVDYRFLYHRDPNFMHDDSTWFLLRKKG